MVLTSNNNYFMRKVLKNSGKLFTLGFFVFFSIFISGCVNDFSDEESDVPTTDATATMTSIILNPPEFSKVSKSSSISYDIDYEIIEFDLNNTYKLRYYIHDTKTGWNYPVGSANITSAIGNVTGSISVGKFHSCYTIFFTKVCTPKTAYPYRLYFSIVEEIPDYTFYIGKSSTYIYNTP